MTDAQEVQVCILGIPSTGSVKCSGSTNISAGTQASLTVSFTDVQVDTPTTYIGELRVTALNAAEPLTRELRVTFSPAAPEIQVSHRDISIQGERWSPFSSPDFATATLVLWEKEGREVHDVAIFGENVMAANGASGVLSIKTQDKEMGALVKMPTAIHIPPQQEVTLTIEPAGISGVGAYTGTLHVRAPTVLADIAVAVSVNVRDRPVFPLVVLALGVLVSSVLSAWYSAGKGRERQGVEIAFHKRDLENLEARYRPDADLWPQPAYDTIDDLLRQAEQKLRALLEGEAKEDIDQADTKLDEWKQAASLVRQAEEQLSRGREWLKSMFDQQLPGGLAGAQEFNAALAALQAGNLTNAKTQAQAAITNYHKAVPYYQRIKDWLDRFNELPAKFDSFAKPLATGILDDWVRGSVLTGYKLLADTCADASLAALDSDLKTGATSWYNTLAFMGGISRLVKTEPAKKKLREALEGLWRQGTTGLETAKSKAEEALKLDEQAKKIADLRQAIEWQEDPALLELEEADRKVARGDATAAETLIQQAQRLHDGFVGDVREAIRLRKGFNAMSKAQFKADAILLEALKALAEGDGAKATQKATEALAAYQQAREGLSKGDQANLDEAAELAPYSPPPPPGREPEITLDAWDRMRLRVPELYAFPSLEDLLGDAIRTKGLEEQLGQCYVQSRDRIVILIGTVIEIAQLNDEPISMDGRNRRLPLAVRQENYRRLTQAIEDVRGQRDQLKTWLQASDEGEAREAVMEPLNQVRDEIERLCGAFAETKELWEFPWREFCDLEPPPDQEWPMPSTEVPVPASGWPESTVGWPEWARLLWYGIVNFRQEEMTTVARRAVGMAWTALRALKMEVTATWNGNVLKGGVGKGALPERLIRWFRCFWRDLTGGGHLPVAGENTLDDNFVFEVTCIKGINSQGQKVNHHSWDDRSTH